MSCVSNETRCKYSQKSPLCHLFISKSAKFYVILAEKWQVKAKYGGHNEKSHLAWGVTLRDIVLTLLYIFL